MNIVNQVKQLAFKHFVANMESGPDHGGTFRTLTSFVADGESKPLLIVGTTHKKVEDGSCIAILNPDKGLLDSVIAGCSYGNVLKKIVAKRCDLMLYLWIEVYQNNRIVVGDRYKARHFQPAKFSVR